METKNFMLQRLSDGNWVNVMPVKYQNYPCCSTYERVIKI